jgi:hypothetical protein
VSASHERRRKGSEHDNAPNGVCSHPDDEAHPMDARATSASVIADLTLAEVWMTAGPPCRNEYDRYALRSVFDEAQGWRNTAPA